MNEFLDLGEVSEEQFIKYKEALAKFLEKSSWQTSFNVKRSHKDLYYKNYKMFTIPKFISDWLTNFEIITVIDEADDIVVSMVKAEDDRPNSL